MINLTDMLLRQADSPFGGRFLRAPVALTGKASELVATLLPISSHVSLKNIVVTAVLLLLMLLSALGVIYSSHASRQLYSEQAIMIDKNDQLQLEWAQLLLEQSAWSSPTRVEALAKEQLGMVIPEAVQIELIY